MNARSQAWLSLLFLLALHGGAYAQSCVSDRECQDGSWCNGVERCEGRYGNAMCMPAREQMCPAKKVCDEVRQTCLSMRKVEEKLADCPEGQVFSDKESKCVAKPPRP
ncbi:hypothetical protein LF41_1316 [Lysobacter dokdonensis DS-58]|uniref:Uncharacterized protein n=1 Tax=Lysobacter dokdonensis DS-58 TaxID=1300345 RepID=A0A0A2WKS1_9GAMM|nr:hypothetical protein [Lysobacter dokdonensis]KGQ20776.1 hypothetical protein LF41_1316 [Lysobacter dokdonensis DS-58]